jgi:hypothetical protein
MGKVKQSGNGTGTVYPRKNKAGKVIGYRGSYFDPAGKRRYVSAKNKGDAEKALRRAMTDADRGIVLDAGTLTVAEYLERWLSDCLIPLVTSGKMEHSTYVRYAGNVNNHISPTLGRKRLRDLTRAEVRALYSAKGKELSPRSVDYIHVTLQKALSQAMRDDLIPATWQQASALVAAATGKRSRPYPPSRRGHCLRQREGSVTRPSTSWRFIPDYGRASYSGSSGLISISPTVGCPFAGRSR